VDGKEPLEAEEIAGKLNLPFKIVKENCFNLTDAGLLNEILTESKENHAFQPAISPEKITIAYIMESLDKSGESAEDYRDAHVPRWSQNLTDDIYVLLSGSDLNKSILDTNPLK